MDIVNQWKLADGDIHEQYISGPNDNSYSLKEPQDTDMSVPYIGNDNGSLAPAHHSRMVCDPWMNLGVKVRCTPCVSSSDVIIDDSFPMLNTDMLQPLKLEAIDPDASNDKSLSRSNILITPASMSDRQRLDDIACGVSPQQNYWTDYLDHANIYNNKPIYKADHSFDMQPAGPDPAIINRPSMQRINPLIVPNSNGIDPLSYMIQHQAMAIAPTQLPNHANNIHLMRMVEEDHCRANNELRLNERKISSPESPNDPSPNVHPKHSVELTKKSYPCGTCGKVFNRSYNQQQHVLIVHATVRKKGFRCTYENCTKSYYRSADLQRHKRTHFQSSLRYSCITCGKSFHRSDQLQKHIPCCRCAHKPQMGVLSTSSQCQNNPQSPIQQQAQYLHSPLSNHSIPIADWGPDK